ncbi:hypothetical protein FACS1894110_09910 [Spirochaetia bacterium]|nr:hypothetical protein FACS1894110_09910 [Spirochaetia bacterium]
MQAILYAGGFTSEAMLSGVAESYSNSDILRALQRGAGQPVGVFLHVGMSDAALAKCRMLKCEGQTLNNANVGQYAALYAVLEPTFKSGNNINLPNMNGIFPQGRNSQTFGSGIAAGTYAGGSVGTKSGDQIRNMEGTFYSDGLASDKDSSYNYFSGVFVNGGASPSSKANYQSGNTLKLNFNASRVAPTGPVNKPGSFTVKWCLTY